jgi:hypothetical protein
MKKDNYFSSYLFSPSKTQNYVLTSPNKTPNYHLLFNNNDYVSRKKDIFKYEKKKEKDNIFKLFNEVPKKEVKKEKVTFKKNYKHLLHSLAILNNANIDEGIILNKYFKYIKQSSIEQKELMKLKYKSMLTPIKQKEKEIQKMKKRIQFQKSISNLMLMKIMIENKEKLNEYIQESKKNNNNSDYIHRMRLNRNMLYFSDKKKPKSRLFLHDGNNKFLTCSNNNSRRRIFKGQFDKKYVPNLKLKDGENENNNNNNENEIFITSYSRNKNQFQFKSNAFEMPLTPQNSIIINQKYYTPQTTKRNSKLYNLNSEKSTGITRHSSKKSCKIKNYNYNNIFTKIK